MPDLKPTSTTLPTLPPPLDPAQSDTLPVRKSNLTSTNTWSNGMISAEKDCSIRSQLTLSDVGPSDAFRDRFFRPASQAPGDWTSTSAGGFSTSAGTGSTQWSL